MAYCTHIVTAFLIIIFIQRGWGIKCYCCNSEDDFLCLNDLPPQETFVIDSGEKKESCYQLLEFDPVSKNLTVVRRGFTTEMQEKCIGLQGASSTTIPKNFQKVNTRSLAGDAFHSLHSDPKHVNDEENQLTVQHNEYTCTICTYDRCNWKESMISVTTEEVTEEIPPASVDGSARTYFNFVIPFVFLSLLLLCS